MHSTIYDRYKIYRYRYINIEKENTKHIQRNKKEKKTIHNISMAKRNQDIEQLKEFANEIAWLEAKLIQQREAREDNNTNSNKKNKKKSKKKKLRNIKTSRSESEIAVKNKWISGQSHSNIDISCFVYYINI